MIQRIVLYATLGVLCSALGLTWDDWGFWSMLGLFWASELITRTETRQQAFVEGIAAYIKMSDEHKANIHKLLKDLDA